jgi:hypothetical protein
MTLFDPPANDTLLPMPGLEPDNLLAFLALMGLLGALEAARPDWYPRACWKGPPWVAQLSLAARVEETEVAQAANEGILELVKHFKLDATRKNVDFEREDYRRYARQVRDDAVAASLAAALTAEWPPKNNGRLPASPLVMMFGQGHQNFLERLVDVPSGKLPNRLRKLNSPPDMTDAGKIAEALFSAWRRKDDADGFRWDPQDDQRYALRYRDPSPEGAAPTVLGANRLAAIGFLSFPTTPSERELRTAGTIRADREWYFVWPIWSQPLSRSCIEALLNHPGLVSGKLDEVRLLGVVEIFRARRVANGKFMNVVRASPVHS